MDHDASDRDDVAENAEPMIATDTSLVAVLESFRLAGWSANHLATTEARIRCGSCDAINDASSITIGAHHRTEGASDPQDMLYVFGFACPVCDSKGAVVAGYGPAASEQDQTLIAALGDDRDAADPVANESS